MAGGAEHIVLPEVPYNIDDLCLSLQNRSIKGQMTSLVVLSEGAGKGADVASYIREKTHLDAKAIVLGYIQRGGDPSAFDRIMATNMGARAVELLIEGQGNRVVGMRDSRIVDYSVDEALQMEMKFDRALYDRHFATHAY